MTHHSQIQQRHDVEVLRLSNHAIFLSDRWGDLRARSTAQMRELKMAGLEPSFVETTLEHMQDRDRFSEEDSFLVLAKDPADIPVENRMFILIEYEISSDYFPCKDDLSRDNAPQLFRNALSFHAPLIAHIASGISRMEMDASCREQIRCLVDLDHGEAASISILLPQGLGYLQTHIQRLMWDNQTPFPPSSHDQVQALGQIQWRHHPQDGLGHILPSPSQPM